MDETEQARQWAAIPWDEPIKLSIARPGQEPLVGFACRHCIAFHGLKALDVAAGLGDVTLFASYEEALAHILAQHAS